MNRVPRGVVLLGPDFHFEVVTDNLVGPSNVFSHFESTCYHPLLLFNREGDCLAARLRPGNVHSADDWEELLLPEIERQQKQGKEVVLQAEAAFAKPEIYEKSEERGVKYAIRIPANDSLERDIAELRTRPVGRPSHKPVVSYKSFLYQAASWKMTRLSCHRFRSNEVRLWLSLIANNLGNLWPGRPLGRVLPKKIEGWSLTSLQQRLVKHACYY